MKFELRTLSAKDVFPMSEILSKIGINEFAECFNSEAVKAAVGEKKKGNERKVGMIFVFEVGNIILKNLSKCEKDLYKFLASLTDANPEDIENLPMGEFFELVVEVVKKPEFADFFKVVSRLFKSDK